MANGDTPKGFAPYGKVLRMNRYEAGSTVYPGDVVTLASDGQVDTTGGTGVILGVAMNYALVGEKLMVCDDPEQRFVAQADETEIDAQTDIGQTCDVTLTAGSSAYKTSRQEVDSSTIGSSKQLVILDYERRPDNALGGFVDAIVRINKHQLVDAFAGI